MKALYQMDVGRVPMPEAIGDFRENPDLDEPMMAYAEELVRAYANRAEEIDKLIADHLTDWDFDRVAAIDRNIMRMATAELLAENDVPHAVTLNESIEIAKRFSTAESGRFVNGVLGQLVKSIPLTKLAVAVPEEEPDEVEPATEELAPEQAEPLLKAGASKIKGD